MTTIHAMINCDVPGPVINPHIYGHFAEHLGHCIYGGVYVGEDSSIPNVRGIRTDVVEALREIQVPNLRWPGGCFADEYHWRDGIGPKEDRPRLVNTHWGNVEENNHFGSHEFLDLCDQLGTAPYICGNVGSGTVREMSEWIEYLTRDGSSPMVDLRKANGREQPWRIPFWGIGNEGWGCGGQMRAEYYADLVRQYATYCRDHGDNLLYKIACGPSEDDYHWTETLMKTVGDLGCGCHPRAHFDAISLHYYTRLSRTDRGSATDFDADAFYATMISAGRIETLLTRHSTVMDCYDPERRIGLVVDEWGTWWDVEPDTNPGFLFQQNTMRDALVTSLHFDAFHRHADRLRMANLAQLINVLQAVLLTDGETLIKTPTYHVFEMNRGHQGATALSVHHLDPIPTREGSGSELELVSMSASTAGDSLLLSISNLDLDQPTRLCVELRGRLVSGAEGRVLTSSSVSDHNTAEQPGLVAPEPCPVQLTEHGLELDLPPCSFVTVKVGLAPTADGTQLAK